MARPAIYHRGMSVILKRKPKRRALGASGVVKTQRLGKEAVVIIGRAKRREPMSQCVFALVGTPTNTHSITP